MMKWKLIASLGLSVYTATFAWQIELPRSKNIPLKPGMAIEVPAGRPVQIVDPQTGETLRLRLLASDGKGTLTWVGGSDLIHGSGELRVVRKAPNFWHFWVRGKPFGLATLQHAPAGGGQIPVVQMAHRTRGLEAPPVMAAPTRGGETADGALSPDLSRAYVGWLPARAADAAVQANALYREGRELDAARMALRSVVKHPDNLASAAPLLSSSNDVKVRELVDSALWGDTALAEKLVITLLESGERRTWVQWLLEWKSWGDAYAVALFACDAWRSGVEGALPTTGPFSLTANDSLACRIPSGLLQGNKVRLDSTAFEKEFSRVRDGVNGEDTAGLARWIGWSAKYPQSGRALALEAMIRLRLGTSDALPFAQTALGRVLDDRLVEAVESAMGTSHEEFLLWLGERHPWAESL